MGREQPTSYARSAEYSSMSAIPEPEGDTCAG